MASVGFIKVISLIPICLVLHWTMANYLTRMTAITTLWQSNGSSIGKTTAISSLIGLILGPLIVSSPFSNRSRYYLKLSAYAIGMSIASTTGILAGLLVPIFNPGWRRNIQWLVARVFYNLISPVVGWKFIVEGEEFLEPCYRGESHVIVGNHQSILDILFLGRIFPKTCVVMSKKEVKYVPLLGQYMLLSRAVFIDRKNRVTASAALENAAKDMKRHGLNLFVFPEGTRLCSPTPDLLPFKLGAFKLASKSNLSVIPMICENYSKLFNSKLKIFKSGRVFVKVFEPMKIKEDESLEEFSNRVRKVMLNGLIELSQRNNSISSPSYTS